MPELAPLHEVSRHHLAALAGPFGIMQHAVGSEPDPAHGSCTDDVARALQVDLLHASRVGWPAVAGSARRNLAFLTSAFDGATGRFRNFRDNDGTWAAGPGSEDAQGRAIHALGDTVVAAPDNDLAKSAASLFRRALPAALELSALRAQASVLLGCDARLRGGHDPDVETGVRALALRFGARFEASIRSDWPWPEGRLTYENALPARALIVTGRRLPTPGMTRNGLLVLDWLIDVQTASGGWLSPIGNGWWPRAGARSRFDQQPIEAATLVLAAEAALAATGDDRYRAAMERAYAWFLGRNDVGVELADPARGACRDGLTPMGANANEGAESTLMWLTTLERIRALRQGAHPGMERAAGHLALATA
ncbi:MAG: hypothetical protein L0227_12160 [Chloroflexi bacterium]|nr:hypothetical protein [Chloroflexota bacterium]